MELCALAWSAPAEIKGGLPSISVREMSQAIATPKLVA